LKKYLKQKNNMTNLDKIRQLERIANSMMYSKHKQFDRDTAEHHKSIKKGLSLIHELRENGIDETNNTSFKHAIDSFNYWK